MQGQDWRTFIQTLKRSGGAWDDEVLLRRKGRGISLPPINTEEGAMLINAIRDISDRKRIEATLHEQREPLQRARQAKDRFLTNMTQALARDNQCRMRYHVKPIHS